MILEKLSAVLKRRLSIIVTKYHCYYLLRNHRDISRVKIREMFHLIRYSRACTLAFHACRRAIDYFSIAAIVENRESRYRSIIHSWERPANNGRFRGVSWWLLYSITDQRTAVSRRRAKGEFSRKLGCQMSRESSRIWRGSGSFWALFGAWLHRSEKKFTRER